MNFYDDMYGKLVLTIGIIQAINESEQFAADLASALTRYHNHDWSDMEHEEDRVMNDEAVRTGEDRIFATYNTCQGKIYIITEYDRTHTTVLFPEEY